MSCLINKQSIDLVIFDCDGVLVDSEIISANILIEYLGSLGIHIEYDYVQTEYLGRSFSYVIEDLAKNHDVLLPENADEVYRQKLQLAFNDELQPIEGITDVLNQLSVEYCLASSSSPERIQNSLANTCLEKWFTDRIFSADQVDNGKPAPDLFLRAAEAMAYNPASCLVIEDSKSGIQAAVSAGMEVVHFTGGSHLKHNKAQIMSNHVQNVPVINEWSEFFELRPDLKKI